MSATKQVTVRELVGWELDEYTYRPVVTSRKSIAREAFEVGDASVSEISERLAALLAEQVQRDDLREEMDGLEWRVGLVDLSRLIAFQRRLIFDDAVSSEPVPDAHDWSALVRLAFGPPVPVTYDLIEESRGSYRFRSENPNFQVRRGSEDGATPLRLHGGSPFFEVGVYRGRWFLRDGYHRAFRLLRAHVVRVPAVIVEARTLAELGAGQPWFFSEHTLFSEAPPRVVDFVDDAKTIEYTRPRLLKSIRVCIEETMDQDLVTCSSGENNE